MFISAALSILLLCATAVFGTRTCGTSISNEHIVANEKHFQAQKTSAGIGNWNTTVQIKVYFHVISQDGTEFGGNIPDSKIKDQISVLNTAHARSNTGISWVLANITRTINKDWFQQVDSDNPLQTTMKLALRQGTYQDLNVYTVNFTLSRTLGYSTIPGTLDSTGNLLADDGIVINHYSLPGGPYPRFNVGHTLTHESGHWVGLYHTFENGCDSPGDHVDDTPYEKSSTDGCPIGRDSCPSCPGLDPIHNYMDYGDDSCMNQFTPGQVARLRAQMWIYRGL